MSISFSYLFPRKQLPNLKKNVNHFNPRTIVYLLLHKNHRWHLITTVLFFISFVIIYSRKTLWNNTSDDLLHEEAPSFVSFVFSFSCTTFVKYPWERHSLFTFPSFFSQSRLNWTNSLQTDKHTNTHMNTERREVEEVLVINRNSTVSLSLIRDSHPKCPVRLKKGLMSLKVTYFSFTPLNASSHNTSTSQKLLIHSTLFIHHLAQTKCYSRVKKGITLDRNPIKFIIKLATFSLFYMFPHCRQHTQF